MPTTRTFLFALILSFLFITSPVTEAQTGTSADLRIPRTILTDWRAASALAQALGEIAVLPDTTNDKPGLSGRAHDILRGMIDYRNSGLNINTLVAVHPEYAIPVVLRAYAAFKPTDLPAILSSHLKESDVVIRATAADLMSELPPNEENARALIAALPIALKDQQLNDAALSIVDALAKQKTAAANEAIKTALESDDHLIRRRADSALKANDGGDFSRQIGNVQTRNRQSDYQRALARIGKRVLATVKTKGGNFAIELLPNEAPLTVDNFVQLARRGYFNGITFHRVVGNFVIQGGDPRGDGSGGPGYSIRCEINMIPYQRGAVGMALSGKDTGGSQWFITHSPQPHLDGGYTVFGRVVSGMDVVDGIVRGDVIQPIAVNETTGRGRAVRHER
ncbi:MAG TPA: peptidylprolyl isomerase [Pyrinomonadaceae bacterium]|nr:peptidylprolyl isomerase [Pyrinomonadaceae bacterium]